MGILNKPGNLLGLTKKLNFIDTAERATDIAARQAKDIYETATSGEKFVNKLPGLAARASSAGGLYGLPLAALDQQLGLSKHLLGDPFKKADEQKLGTKGRQQIEKIPLIGRELGVAADIGLSPLTIGTAGAGSSLSASLRGVPVAGKALSALASPVGGTNFASRLGVETATGLGAYEGSRISELLPESTPGAVKAGAGLFGGALGSMVGAKGGVTVLNAKSKPNIKQEMSFGKGRIKGDEEKRFIPNSVGLDKYHIEETPKGSWKIYHGDVDLNLEYSQFQFADNALYLIKKETDYGKSTGKVYPQPLHKERLWAHATKDYSFDLPDPELAVGQATFISQGAGLYMAANPENVTWAGDRMFISVVDENANIMNMGEAADFNVWNKVAKDLGIELDPRSIMGDLSTGNINNFHVRDALADALWQQAVSMNRAGVVDSPMEYVDNLMNRKWRDKLKNTSRGGESKVKTVINEKLGDNGVDGFFYKSSHEDEVIVMINGEKARVLGEADLGRLPSYGFNNKRYKDLVGWAFKTGPEELRGVKFIEKPDPDKGTIWGAHTDGRKVAEISQDRQDRFVIYLPQTGMEIYRPTLAEAQAWVKENFPPHGSGGFPLKPMGKAKTSAIDFLSGSSGGRQSNVIGFPGSPGAMPPTAGSPPIKPPTRGGPTATAAAGASGSGGYVRNNLFTTVNNALRSAGASLDNSILGIQNLLGYTTVNPKMAAKIAGKSFQSMFDSKVSAKFQASQDAAVMAARAAGKPSGRTMGEWVGDGLEFAPLNIVPGTKNTTFLNNIPGYRHTTQMFNTGANMMRRAMADSLYETAQTPGVKSFINVGGAPDSKAIAKAVNRATGTTDKSFGMLDDAFFAPKFLMATVELFEKAMIAPILKGLRNGTVDEAIARRQLGKLFALGVPIVWLANEARGEETDFDPTSSNFLRIKNVAGQDISLFSYLDTAIRGAAGIGKDVKELGTEGDTSFDDSLYILRSKSSPLVGVAIDLIKGSTFTGEDPSSISSFVKLIAPFSIRDTDIPGVDLGAFEGDKPFGLGTAAGALGIKSTPLSPKEKLDKELEDAGIKSSDPDYEIKRRQFLFDNPDKLPKTFGDAKEARSISEDIRRRATINEQRFKDGELTVKAYKEARKTLLTEQRNKKSMLDLGRSSRSSKQNDWLDSYFELYDQPGIKDEVTGEINGDAFDAAVVNWQEDYGPEATEYIAKYMEAAKLPVESEYIRDLRKLKDLGYFEMKKYRNLQSGKTEEELDDLRNIVSAEKAVSNRLSKMSFERAARTILREKGYDNTVILDVIRIGRKAYQNREYAKFKEEHEDLLQWLKPNATWASIQKARENRAAA